MINITGFIPNKKDTLTLIPNHKGKFQVEIVGESVVAYFPQTSKIKEMYQALEEKYGDFIKYLRKQEFTIEPKDGFITYCS